MKIAFEYPVDATIHIGRIIHASKQEKEYILIPNEEGALKAIRIVATVLNPGEVVSRIKPGGQGVQATITIAIGRTLYDELIAEFQELESTLSFSTSGAFRKIIWSKLKREFIPETENESAAINIPGLQSEISYPRKCAKLDESEFSQLIDTKEKYSPLVIPKSFYREGLIEYEELRYINAFHNFYYILEDLYGGGKTKSRDVINEMKSSQEFREIMQWALRSIKREPKHLNALRTLFDSEKLHFDADGFIELLVRTRGRTHHYTSKAGHRYPTPFRQADYHSIAWITLGIAVAAITYKIAAINKS